MSTLKKDMPSMFGKDTKKKELISGLAEMFAKLQQQHQISGGDFPSVQRMQEQLQYHDFSKFPLLKPKLLDTVDRMLADDIARLMTIIPKEEEQRSDAAIVKVLFCQLDLSTKYDELLFSSFYYYSIITMAIFVSFDYTEVLAESR